MKMKLTSRDRRMNNVHKISLEGGNFAQSFTSMMPFTWRKRFRYLNSLIDCLCDGNANLSGKSFVSVSGNLLVGKIITVRKALASGSGLFGDSRIGQLRDRLNLE